MLTDFDRFLFILLFVVAIFLMTVTIASAEDLPPSTTKRTQQLRIHLWEVCDEHYRPGLSQYGQCSESLKELGRIEREETLKRLYRERK